MITVFGLGFVGLTTALGFAHLGYRVYGVDVDEARKAILRRGELPFLEPDMQEILQEHLGRNFQIADSAEKAVTDSEYIFYCVGTPYGNDGSADLTYLFSAIDTTLSAVRDNKFRVLVTKSTIPPTTTRDRILPYVREHCPAGRRFGVANNPEFLREGHCWQDFMQADRIVLGVSDNESKEMLERLYTPMGIPIECVTTTTGEYIKYLSNTLLATLISYSNEMAEVADRMEDVEVSRAFRILHMDKRWNGCDMTSYVYPGCGYGGYCLPKDTNALLAQSKAKGFEPQILKHVIATNEHRPQVIASRIAGNLPHTATIGILGLAFKPGSDDVRDTPAAHVIGALTEMGYKNILAYDPAANEEFAVRYPELPVKVRDSVQEVYQDADVIAVTTAWEDFREVPALGDKPIIDCRYMF